jgi:hypothetical protein
VFSAHELALLHVQVVEEAQEALGGAYAWLEDVTAKDWTRYHDLKDGEYLDLFRSTLLYRILLPY